MSTNTKSHVITCGAATITTTHRLDQLNNVEKAIKWLEHVLAA